MKPNHITFADGDLFKRETFARRLEKYLLVEHRFVGDSLVVALDSGFGGGKTTFLRMWEHDLLSRRDAGDMSAPMPLVLNAWESDHCGDPLVAIMAALLDHLEEWKGIEATDKTLLTECAKDIAWLGLGLANQAVATLSGFDLQKAADFAEKKNVARNPPRPDLLAAYRERVSALERLQSGLKRVFESDAPKLIVIVDELDRCRPDYAVSYLEAIKHVFAIRGMIFVLSLDLAQFQHSVGALYGAGLDFKEYFRKFAHRTVRLPGIAEECSTRMIDHYLNLYVSDGIGRITKLEIGRSLQNRIHEIFKAFPLRPRQIQEAFRILGHFMETEDPSLRGRSTWGNAGSCILLCALRIANLTLFGKVLIGDPEKFLADLCEELTHRMGNKAADWWIGVVLTGSLTENLPKDFHDSLLRKMGYLGQGALPQQFFNRYVGFLERVWQPPSKNCRVHRFFRGLEIAPWPLAPSNGQNSPGIRRPVATRFRRAASSAMPRSCPGD